MKPKSRFATKAFHSTLTLALTSAFSLHAADIVWDGGPSGTGTSLGLAENWVDDLLPSLATPDTAVWDGSAAGPLSLIYDNSALAGSAGNPGLDLRLASTQSSALSLDSGANTASIRLNNITLENGSGLFTLGDGNDLFNITLGGAGGQIHTWSNQATQSAIVQSEVRFGLGGGGNHALHFTGSGNWDVRNSLTPTNAANLSIHKTGTGELTLSGGGTLTGGVAAFGGSFAATLKEGTTRITGGAFNAGNTEVTVGGLDTGAGTNTQLILDAGSLANVSWMSIGRGNGDGTASSDVILNNSATLSSANLSMGFNASAATAPKGSLTLNQNSSYTVTGGSFFVGESAGSNMTITLNNDALLTSTATGDRRIGAGGTGALVLNNNATVNFGSQQTYIGYRAGHGTLTVNGGALTAGQMRVGGSDANGTAQNGSGTVTLNNGTLNLGSLFVARGNNNQNTVSGIVSVKGGTLNSEGDITLGFAGNANLGRLVVDGGTVNVATTSKRWFIFNQWDTARGQLDVESGNLNLNADTDLRFSTGNAGSTATSVLNLNGGAITSYSGNQSGLGAGVLDLMTSGGAASNNSANLNGGVLAIREVLTSQNHGTATLNFNGGTLRATGNTANFINLGGASQTTNILASGGTIDTNGFDVTIPEALRSAGGDGGLTKTGTGTLTLSSLANHYDGATIVSAGTLLVTGALGATDVSVQAGASIGGSGTLGGSLHFAAGSLLDIAGGALSVAGPITFESFGFANLANFDVFTAADGEYTVLNGNIDSNGITNFGLANALDLGGGRSAYFTEGSLKVVVIPEPSAFLLGSLAGLCTLLRRRRNP